MVIGSISDHTVVNNLFKVVVPPQLQPALYIIAPCYRALTHKMNDQYLLLSSSQGMLNMSNKNASLRGIKWLSAKHFAYIKKHRTPKDGIAPYCVEIIACSENMFVCLDVNQTDTINSCMNDVAFHCSLMVKKVLQHLIARNVLKSAELVKLLSSFSFKTSLLLVC